MDTMTTIVKSANGGFDTLSSGTPVLPMSSPPSPSILPVPRPTVDPHRIVHKKLRKPVLGVLGAEVLDSNMPLLNPTIDMVARALGVSASYIAAARKLSPEARREVVRGNRPLVRHKSPPSVVTSVEQRLKAIVAEVGIDGVLGSLATIARNTS